MRTTAAITVARTYTFFLSYNRGNDNAYNESARAYNQSDFKKAHFSHSCYCIFWLQQVKPQFSQVQSFITSTFAPQVGQVKILPVPLYSPSISVIFSPQQRIPQSPQLQGTISFTIASHFLHCKYFIFYISFLFIFLLYNTTRNAVMAIAAAQINIVHHQEPMVYTAAATRKLDTIQNKSVPR